MKTKLHRGKGGGEGGETKPEPLWDGGSSETSGGRSPELPFPAPSGGPRKWGVGMGCRRGPVPKQRLHGHLVRRRGAGPSAWVPGDQGSNPSAAGPRRLRDRSQETRAPAHSRLLIHTPPLGTPQIKEVTSRRPGGGARTLTIVLVAMPPARHAASAGTAGRRAGRRAEREPSSGRAGGGAAGTQAHWLLRARLARGAKRRPPSGKPCRPRPSGPHANAPRPTRASSALSPSRFSRFPRQVLPGNRAASGAGRSVRPSRHTGRREVVGAGRRAL